MALTKNRVGQRAGLTEMSSFARLSLLLVAIICVFCSAPASARKIALIIGNSAYANTSALTNPANDARLVASAARAAGFEVTIASDLTMSTFQRTLRDFRVAADGSEVAMIYYAGHGIEGQGKNWLIPVDSILETQFDLPYEAVNMDRFLEALGGAKVRIVILDSCRNNPFGNAWKAGIRAVPMGLNGTEYEDVLVIYAAAPGQTATEGTGANSPFAASLARRLPEPGLPIQLLGGAVRDDVLAATGGKQRPFVSASITGTPIFLVEANKAVQMQIAVAPAPPALSTSSSGDRSMLDALMWQGAFSSNTLAGFQAYLREFPVGVFSNAAKESIAKFQSVPSPVVVTPTVPTPGTIASVSVVPMPTLTNSTSITAAKDDGGTQLQNNPGFVTSTTDKSPGNGALPTMPVAPRFTSEGYPNCRDDFQSIIPTLDKIGAINRCTVALDQYYKTALITFRQAMIDHQRRISTMYSEQVGGQMKFLAEGKSQFFKAMMQEHSDSNPDGKHFSEYRSVEVRYKDDRAFLQDRYCFNTGCGGYTAPAFVFAPTKKSPKN